MKNLKKILIIILTIVMVLPSVASAEEYTYTDLPSTLKADSISISNTSYSETDDMATIYLFWGSSCSHCKDFLEYLNELSATEYGAYFKLRAYEVWNNDANSNLMTTVGTYLGKDVSGVPFYVIGSKSYSGFSSASAETLKAAIKAEYESTTKTNIIDLAQSGATQTSESVSDTTSTTDDSTSTTGEATKNNSTGSVVGLLVLAVVAGFAIYLVDARKKNASVEETVQPENEETKKVTKKAAKKTTKKTSKK